MTDAKPKASYWGQHAKVTDPPAEQSGYGRYDFTAYDVQGTMLIATWTDSPGTFQAEVHAYQARLNRDTDKVARVEVYRQRTLWHHPEKLEPAHWTMYPQAKGKVRE